MTPNHGRPVKTFSEALFLREPMIQRDRKEFALRLICWDDYKKLSLSTKADDLFVIGYGDAAGAALKDVNLEILEAEKFDEIKYILGISNAY